MENSRFKLTYELPDYGKLLFDFDGNLNGLEMSKQRRKAMFRSVGFYYLITPVFVMVVWFIASLIINSIKYGFLKSVGLHASGFFALFVMSLILLLSAFGGWGKFMRWAGRRNLADIKGFNQNEREREEVSQSRHHSIQIYEEYLVVTNFGWSQAYYFDKVAQVILESADKFHTIYKVKFISVDGEEVKSYVQIPREKTIIIQLKKIFGEKLKIKNAGQTKKTAVLRRNKSIGSLIGLTLFVSIPILAGIGVILMHFYVAPSIPAVLGVFFIFGGCIALCGVYDFVPALKDVLVPILFGSVFLFFPMSIIQVIIEHSNAGLTLKQMFGIFHPISVAVFFFGWLGLLCIFVGIKNLIDYIRYRDKKEK